MGANVRAFAFAAPVGERDSLLKGRRATHGCVGGGKLLQAEVCAMGLLKSAENSYGGQRTRFSLCRQGPPTETEKALR